ncbi:hypothetical protein BC938DRAFT_477757 [Jimgerdemannia flammicorona]|uniref:Uncharacterized protein n=1 Tax=Jimgerdemannia flammicorona TaxID=994334 RepID=A0A433QNV9_9FUNG|nr:hypothetical protein BC938DRAFT_477757 [Jimgerdemannia flammicorona]
MVNVDAMEPRNRRAYMKRCTDNVVDVEARMRVVEGQEPVQRKLRSEVIILARQHLLAHTGADLGGEIQNGPETEVATFAALVVFSVFNSSATCEGADTCINIFVEMKTLLRLAHTAARGHENTVQKVRMTVMQFAADLGHDSLRHSAERLLLAGSDVSQNANILREDVFARPDDCHWRDLTLLHRRLLELAKDVADLEALLQVVVLVRVNQLQILATVEDERVILVIGLAVAQDRVPWQPNAEPRLTPPIRHHLAVAVDQS